MELRVGAAAGLAREIVRPSVDAPIDRSDVTLAVLVGGRGTRLGGRAKGNLKLGGRTLLERQLASADCFSEVVLAGDDAGAHAGTGVRRVPDRVAGRGALAGLVSALCAARTPWVLVIACDMPGLASEALAALGAAVDARHDGACFVDAAGGLHPFPGLYRARLGPQLEAALAGEASVRALISALALVRVPAPTPGAIANVNTWDDARRLGVEDL